MAGRGHAGGVCGEVVQGSTGPGVPSASDNLAEVIGAGRTSKAGMATCHTMFGPDARVPPPGSPASPTECRGGRGGEGGSRQGYKVCAKFLAGKIFREK